MEHQAPAPRPDGLEDGLVGPDWWDDPWLDCDPNLDPECDPTYPLAGAVGQGGVLSDDQLPVDPFPDHVFLGDFSRDDRMPDDHEWTLHGADHQSVPARFDAALERLRSAAQELIGLGADPGLVLAGREELVDWAQRLERSANMLQVPGQALINLSEAAGCRIDGPTGMYASPQGFLNALLGIPIGQAKARVQAASLLAPSIGMRGERIEPRYPVLAEAQATGDISPDRTSMLVKALSEWEKLLDVEGGAVTVEAMQVAERALAAQAKVFGGRDLERVIERIGDHLNPDGMIDDRPAQQAVRSFSVKPVTRGLHKGMYRAEGWLEADTGAKSVALLEPLAKPEPVTDHNGRLIEPDRRDHDMRMHDAFGAVLDRALQAGDLPAHGGIPTTLILTAEADELFGATESGASETSASEASDFETSDSETSAPGTNADDRSAVTETATGFGFTETGDRLPIKMVRSLADEAEIVRTVFQKETRDVLYLGRTRRIASYAQTLALAARDGGCTFPGCSKSPKWCQRHHIVDWAHGGPTDLPNLTLLCAFHHYRFAQHGWTAAYQNGRVWWRPPKIIDPQQRPILNTRHRPEPLLT